MSELASACNLDCLTKYRWKTSMQDRIDEGLQSSLVLVAEIEGY